jgi:hypothetical protein
MFLFKNYLILISCLTLSLTLSAGYSDMLTGQAPPHTTNTSDTGAFALPGLRSNAENVSAFDAVEDTILPPCDVIFFKSGKLDYCKIIETSPTTITYKMCDYQDGPNIIVNKTDVHKIRYANGREEVVIPSQQNQMNAYVKARKDPMSTWALILSIVGFVIVPAMIAGVVLGIISLNRIRKSNGQLRGKGTAKAAIIIGGILIFLTILLYI